MAREDMRLAAWWLVMLLLGVVIGLGLKEDSKPAPAPAPMATKEAPRQYPLGKKVVPDCKEDDPCWVGSEADSRRGSYLRGWFDAKGWEYAVFVGPGYDCWTLDEPSITRCMGDVDHVTWEVVN